jgi:hypothetical protein
MRSLGVCTQEVFRDIPSLVRRKTLFIDWFPPEGEDAGVEINFHSCIYPVHPMVRVLREEFYEDGDEMLSKDGKWFLSEDGHVTRTF